MRLVLALTIVSLVASGCGGGDSSAPETRTTPPDQTAVPQSATGGACQKFIPTEPQEAPKGLILPAEGEVTVGKITEVPPQIRVEGYVAGQPSAVRNSFISDERVKVIFSEDEGFEAEALVSDGRHRNFWKVAKACDRGSVFVAIVVREEKPFKVKRPRS